MQLSFPDLLAAFATHVGLDPAALSATQELVVDEHTIGLKLEGDDTVGDLVVFTALGTPTPDYLIKIAPVLLEANNFWVGTGGATLGLRGDTGEVTLCVRLQLPDLGAESLAAVIDAYADTATYWRAFVAGTIGADTASTKSFVNPVSRA